MLSRLVLLLALTASADRGVPLSNSTHAVLPNGVRLEVQDGALVLERDGTLAPVPLPEDSPGYRAPVKALAQLTTTDDRRFVVIRYSDACGDEDELRFALSTLWARTEYAQGLAAYERKDWAAAAKLFARALQADPNLDAAAAQLAAALAQQDKLPEALDAYDPLISKDAARAYLKCLTDPDLAPLLNGPRLVNLRAAVPGTAQLKEEDALKGLFEFAPGRPVAYETARRLAAAVVRVIDAPADPEDENGKYRWHASLHLLDAKTGTTLLRLPLVLAEETGGSDSVVHIKPVLASKAKAVARRVGLANRALAELGLSAPEQVKGVLERTKETPAGVEPYSFAAAGLRLTASSSGTVELKDLSSVRDPSQLAGPEKLEWAVWLPGPRLAAFQWGQYPGEGCPKNTYDGIGVLRP